MVKVALLALVNKCTSNHYLEPIIMSFLRFIPGLLFSFMLIACGGGGGSDDKDGGSGGGVSYSGNTSQATISSSNEQDLALAASLGVVQAQKSGATPAVGVVISSSYILDQANQLVNITYQLHNMPLGTDVSSQVCPSGGTANISDGASQTNITIVYSSCRFDDVTASGTAVISITDTTFSISYTNFAITVDGETTTLNMTVSCNSSGTICTITSDFIGENGRAYRVTDTTVSGNSSTGYNVSATVYDGEHGSITVTATAVTFNCDNGLPGSGTVTFSDGSTTATVTFNSCTNYTLTIDGVANDYDW